VEIVYDLVVVLHFVGLASLLGGVLVQLRSSGERRILPAMNHGALTQLVTGLVIVGLGEAVLDRDYDQVKVAVKLAVTLVVVVLVWVNRRRELVPDGLYALIGLLTLANVVVAVLW
jgi:hypothetical protein